MDQFSDGRTTDNRDLFTDSRTQARKKDLTEVTTEITTESNYTLELTQIATQELQILDQSGTDPEPLTEILLEIQTEMTQIETMQFPDMEKTVILEPETIQGEIEEPKQEPVTQNQMEYVEPVVILATQTQNQDQEPDRIPETVNPELLQAVLEINQNLNLLREGVLSGDETTTEAEPEGTTETDITLEMLKDSINENFLEMQSVVEIIAKDQQLIGQVTVGANLVLIGVFVVYLFFGRIR